MTLDLDAMRQSYVRRTRRADRDAQRLKADIEHLQAELKRTEEDRPCWVDALVHPIRDALGEQFPDWTFEVSGPFGIGCNVHLSAQRSDEEAPAGYLLFRPGDLDEGEVLVVRYWEDTGEYAPGSLGRMNDLHHPTMPLPSSFDELVALFLRKE